MLLRYGDTLTYLLHRFLFLLLLVIVELGLQLEDFTLFGGGEVFGIGHPWRIEHTQPGTKVGKFFAFITFALQ